MTLAHQAVRGAAVILISSYANLLIGFFVTITLTRLLPPDAFGLFALCSFFFLLFDLRNKLGLDYAYIHRQPTTDELTATHWLLQTALSLFVLVLALLSPLWLPWVGATSSATAVLIALSLTGVIEAMGTTARASLEKELRFNRSTLIVSMALLVSNALAVLAALRGAGVWALVAQVSANAVIGTVGFWVIAPTRLRLCYAPQVARWLIRYGAAIALGSVATIVVLQGDNFMVGTFAGLAALGYYERAYKVAQWPTGLVTHVISRAAFPTYAKLQDDRPRLSKAFGLTVWVIVSAATPLALALFVSAPDFIALIFGESWAPTGVLLRFLIGYSVLRPLLDDTGALLSALGKPARVTQLVGVEAVVLIV
ncbi:MAG: oligosaccharide flippase family protein, partial [Chloroflexi bacterium]|nr:oligosaccharide flippase family protein [Chloroflexota bacterium]